MVLRSVGYQSVPLPGVPFDPRGVRRPERGRPGDREDGKPVPGEYVAGWIKRGPTGVIGTNKADAAETVARCSPTWAGAPRSGPRSRRCWSRAAYGW